MRQIQHNIDLMPGASIPHSPRYKMSPREDEILQRIVDDLLAKNLIHPSLSPCTNPALSVPKKVALRCLHQVATLVLSKKKKIATLVDK